MKNIFSSVANSNNSNRLIMESKDFCYESYLINMETVLEDMYYMINENHLYAAHVSAKSDLSSILMEGLSDFSESVVKFFKTIIDKLKEFFKKALMYLNSYIGNFENFIKKYSSELSSRNVKFTYTGYNFTVDKDINFSIMDEMISSFNSNINNISNMKKSDILDERKSFMSENHFNKIRGVLTNSSTCTEGDYNNAVFKMYRNNDKDKINMDITSSVVSEIASSYPDMNKKLKDSKKDRDDIINKLESIKSFFTKGASLDYINGNKTIRTNTISTNKNVDSSKIEIDYNSDNLANINIYFNYKLAYSKKITNLYSVLLVEKTKAIKEYLKQSKNIVRKALFNKEEGVD